MIRPRWLPNAKAILAARARFLSSSGASEGRWTIPGAPSRPGAADVPDEFAQWRRPQPVIPKLSPAEEQSRKEATQEFKKPSDRTNHMLIVEGLPTSLRSSDFQRLASKDLSNWSNIVNDVQQERDPWTLEPLGTYRISFSSASAAELYQAKIARLLRLAQIKLHSATGLWTTEVPASMRGDGNLAEELASFTLAPGSYPDALHYHRSRVKGKWPWQRLMDVIIDRSGFRVSPAAVFLQLRHATVSAAELKTLIDEDGVERNHPWSVSTPYHLVETLQEDQRRLTKNSTRVALPDDLSFRQKLDTRFVLVCKAPDVAWRFIRSWNQRTLQVDRGEEGSSRTTVAVSYLEL
ncbi:hypothetical protein FZEAL_5109 [Fusarium zealandicum]|uniref:Uncharacterized protein n=1 Tax=Fusarium zealandicum TaxID=1053134 RepID=A0A8H4UKD4_9HYPO|nr:hypothetical protein FZEAL_5109 [Fusarium zealandicum]